MTYKNNQAYKNLITLIFFLIVIVIFFQLYQLIIKNHSLGKQNKKLQDKLATLEDKTKYNSSSTRCNKNVDIWQFLPKEIQGKTYKKGIISPGQSTYDLILLKWSDDCKYLPFILELVGRGAEAYGPEDFKPRGLYILDDNLKQIKTVKLVAINSFIDYLEPYSNYWFGEKYVFSESEDDGKSQFVTKRYNYDFSTNLLAPHEE